MATKKTAAKKAASTKSTDTTEKKADSAPPSKPIESPQIKENTTEELPQPAVVEEKKTTPKKAKKLSVEEVAELLLDNSRRWGTGRDRDTNLANEGYDLNEVRRAVVVARGKRVNPS